MADPHWKQYVDAVAASGHASAYLDRLRARNGGGSSRAPAGRGFAALEVEIVQEMASSLGRAEDKVNLALLRLEVAGRAIDALALRRANGEDVGGALEQQVAAFNRDRERAQQALWELRVHREALGFRRNDRLEDYYPIPPKRAA